MSKTFTPPQAVRSAAKRGLEMRRNNGGKGGLDAREASAQGIGSGVVRAQNLSSGQGISYDTIKRMKAFFDRHEKNKHGPNGKVAWALWGGDAGRAWANSIIKQEEGGKMDKAMTPHQKQAMQELDGEELTSSVPGHSEEETSSPAVPDRMVQANPRVLEEGRVEGKGPDGQKVQILGEEHDHVAGISHPAGTLPPVTMRQQAEAGSQGPGRLEGAEEPMGIIALVISRPETHMNSMLSMHKSEWDMPPLAKAGDSARDALLGYEMHEPRRGEKFVRCKHCASQPVLDQHGEPIHSSKIDKTPVHASTYAAFRGRGGGKCNHCKKPLTHSEAGVVEKSYAEETSVSPHKKASKIAKSLAEFLINDAVGSRRGHIRRSYREKFANPVSVLEANIQKAMRGEVRLSDIGLEQSDLVDAVKAVSGKDLIKSSSGSVMRRRAEDTLAQRVDEPGDLLYVRRVLRNGIGT